MKVMCIKDNWCNADKCNPSFGEVVNVSQYTKDGDYWEVQEYLYDDNGVKKVYTKKAFAPLSNIDETELIEERQLQTV